MRMPLSAWFKRSAAATYDKHKGVFFRSRESKHADDFCSSSAGALRRCGTGVFVVCLDR